MIILGWIFTVLGTVLSIVGKISYNDAQQAGYGLYKYYNNSDVQTAETIMTIGIILAVIGVVCLIIGYFKKYSSGGSSGPKNNLLNTKKCLKCGNIVDATQNFCPKCGNDLTKQGKIQNTD